MQNESSKKQKNRGMILVFIGMLFTTVGMALMSLEQPAWIYFTSSVLGVLFALVGVILLVKDAQKK